MVEDGSSRIGGTGVDGRATTGRILAVTSIARLTGRENMVVMVDGNLKDLV